MYCSCLQLGPTVHYWWMLNFRVGHNATSCNTWPHVESRPSNIHNEYAKGMFVLKKTLCKSQFIGLLLTSQVRNLRNPALDSLIYCMYATANPVHGRSIDKYFAGSLKRLLIIILSCFDHNFIFSWSRHKSSFLVIHNLNFLVILPCQKLFSNSSTNCRLTKWNNKILSK